eukprot:1918264-Amphidinium_carterae.2
MSGTVIVVLFLLGALVRVRKLSGARHWAKDLPRIAALSCSDSNSCSLLGDSPSSVTTSLHGNSSHSNHI